MQYSEPAQTEPDPPPPADNPDADVPRADFEKQNQVWDMICDMVGNDEAKAHSLLKVTYACMDITKVVGKTLDVLFGKVVVGHQKWQEEQK